MDDEPSEREYDRPDFEDVEDLLEDLEDIEEEADSPDERHVLRRTARTLHRLSGASIFGTDDLAQQIVGGFVLSAPFEVTEEVW